MRATIFGTGYVGLVTGACLAETGNRVVCVDIDPEKIGRLQHGEIPIHEPGLEELVQRGIAADRLQFTTDVVAGVDHGLFQFIAVGTPPGEDGSADMQHVITVARSIGEHLNDYRIIVDKSTVPVGTADQITEEIRNVLSSRGVNYEFDVVSNPEFLKEGAAIEDFMKPDRIIVGTQNPRVGELLRALYEPFNRSHDRMLMMDVRSAELTKYAANAMLATKISFMNELANIAERVGADIEQVRLGIGSDPRIGYEFIYPGIGYGGSCFPKDVKALQKSAESLGYEAELLSAVEGVNNRQKDVLFQKIHSYFDGHLKNKTIALWGLAFKPNTDDIREASSRVLMERLWEHGANVRAYDPVASGEVARLYGDKPDLALCDSAGEALQGADVLAIATEWREFRSPDFENIAQNLSERAIFDGRNLYDLEILKQYGIRYYGIGRGEAIALRRHDFSKSA